MASALFRLCGIALALATLLLAACSPQRENPLRLGAAVWPGYEGFFLARSLGYYHNSPIQLVEYLTSAEVFRAFQNQAIDAAALTLDETLRLAENDPAVRIVLVLDFSNGADVLLAQPQFDSLTQLRGKRVGVEVGLAGAYLLRRAFDSVNLSTKEVTVVPLAAFEHVGSYRERRVDAVVTYEPQRTRVLAMGAKILFDSSKIPGEIVDVLVVRAAAFKDQPKGLETLLKGWFQAQAFIRTKSADAIRLMAPREGVTPEEFRQSLALLRIPDLAENRQLLGSSDPGLSRSVAIMTQVMKEVGFLRREAAPGNLLDDRFFSELP